MKPEAILQSDLLDILFEGRNKSYGAYTLRRDYNQRMLISLGIVFFTLMALLLMYHFKPQNQRQVIPPIDISDTLQPVTVILEPPLPDPIEPMPSQPVKTIDLGAPVIVPNDLADTMVSIDELLNTDAIIGAETIEGPPIVGNVPPPSATGKGNGEEEAPVPVVENKVWEKVERMPEFPGGMKALYRYLSRTLRVPEDELNGGERVKLVVRFVVNTDGSISAINFVQGGETVFEKEVIRVIRKMPAWTPGFQNGRNVPVYFSVPVIFEGYEEQF